MPISIYNDLVNRPEAARYLCVSVATLAAWASEGRYDLPYIKVGRLVKYRKADLDSFLQRRTQNATPVEAA